MVVAGSVVFDLGRKRGCKAARLFMCARGSDRPIDPAALGQPALPPSSPRAREPESPSPPRSSRQQPSRCSAGHANGLSTPATAGLLTQDCARRSACKCRPAARG